VLIIDWLNVVSFTAPVDVAKDAILVASETLTADRFSFEIGQCTVTADVM